MGERTSEIKQLGYFGNIWVRAHHMKNKGNSNGGGHLHHFDHVTLLARGSVEVEVEGHSPKIFKSPNFIVIKKEHKHKITALEDDTLYYCVYALRDVNGEVTDLYSGDNSPYDAVEDPEIEEKLSKLDAETTHEH